MTFRSKFYSEFRILPDQSTSHHSYVTRPGGVENGLAIPYPLGVGLPLPVKDAIELHVYINLLEDLLNISDFYIIRRNEAFS